MSMTALLTTMAALWLFTAGPAPQDTCLHGATESADQRTRRESAMRFVKEIQDNEGRFQSANGRFGSLSDVRGSAVAPTGFVPRLVFDQWGYVISVKDALDPCGFALFGDDNSVVYEGRPAPAAAPADKPASAT